MIPDTITEYLSEYDAELRLYQNEDGLWCAEVHDPGFSIIPAYESLSTTVYGALSNLSEDIESDR